MAKVTGVIICPSCGHLIEVDAEAYDESPDVVVVPPEGDGPAKLVGIDSPLAEGLPRMEFYVVHIECDNEECKNYGETFTVTGPPFPEGLELIYDEDDE